MSRSTQRYRRQPRSDDGLRQRLGELARQRQSFGYRRLTALRQREGRSVNQKRVYRRYRDLDLALRVKRRRRRRTAAVAAKEQPYRPNQHWAMDFVRDRLASGQNFRAFPLVDPYTREGPAIEVDTSLPSRRVIRVRERLAQERGWPEEITCDNGPEFVSRRRQALRYIAPGKPQQNGHAESCNGRFRKECLNANWFLDMADARRRRESWRQDDSALAYRTPDELASLFAAPPAAVKQGRKPELILRVVNRN